METNLRRIFHEDRCLDHPRAATTGNLLDPKSWRNPRRDLDDARSSDDSSIRLFHPPGCFVERLSIIPGKGGDSGSRIFYLPSKLLSFLLLLLLLLLLFAAITFVSSRGCLDVNLSHRVLFTIRGWKRNKKLKTGLTIYERWIDIFRIDWKQGMRFFFYINTIISFSWLQVLLSTSESFEILG